MKKVLSSMLALTLCVGAFGFPVNVASANSEEPAGTAAGTFKMAEGASVCVSDPGIRFRVEIADDVVATAKAADDFGFLVFPQEYLATAKANVTADPTLQYHDKFDGVLEEGNVVPADKVGTYGLFDYAEVSMSDEDLEAAVYTYKDGKQYVNVIYQDEVLENVDAELTALAWYKNGETYTYAELNESFSRSVAYVAQQEYIAGEYSRENIMKSFSWLAEDTFEIRSSEDMDELSVAVTAGEAFENIKFALTTSVVAEAQVPNTFKGNFDYNGKKIFIVEDGITSAFAENEYATLTDVNDKVVDDYLLQANSDNAAKLQWGTGSLQYTDRSSFVENATLGGETVSALKFAFTTTGNTHVSVKLDYSAEEIELLRPYVAPYVTFRAYVETPVGSTLKTSAFPGAFNLCGYADWENIVRSNYWLDIGLSLDQAITLLDTNGEAYGDKFSNTLYLGRLTSSLAEGVNLYITDVKFASEMPELEAPVGDLTLFAVNGGITKYGACTGEYVTTGLPAGDGAPTEAIKATSNGVRILSVNIKPNYTKAKLQTMLEKGWFDTITFKMYIEFDEAVKNRNTNYVLSYATGGMKTEAGNTLELTRGEWVTYTVSLSTILNDASDPALIEDTGYWKFILLNNAADQLVTLYFSDVTLTKSASSAQ